MLYFVGEADHKVAEVVGVLSTWGQAC